MPDDQEWHLYGGSVQMRFIASRHQYETRVLNLETKQSEVVKPPSVTSICSVINKEALVQWAASLSAQTFLEEAEKKQPPTTPDGLREWLKETKNKAQSRFREVSKQSTTLGSQAHEWIEAFLRVNIGNAITSKTAIPPIPEAVTNPVKAAIEWMQEREFIPLQIEVPIYSRIFQYAGRLDCVAMVNGRKAILDWKTSKAIYQEYFLQSAAYLFADAEESGSPAEGRYIVRLPKENKKADYTHRKNGWQMHNDMSAFLCAMRLYKLLNDKGHRSNKELPPINEKKM